MAADEVFEKVDLPSGGWVAFRDPELVTERQLRGVRRLQTRAGLDVDLQAVLRRVGPDAAKASPMRQASQADLSDEQLDLLADLTNATTAVLVESWSFDGEPSADAIQDLSRKDYAALIEVASKHRATLLPEFGVDPSPDSPTDASAD